MTLQEFAELVLTLRIEQIARYGTSGKAPLFGFERDVDNALLAILPNTCIQSSTTGHIKRRTPRPDPMPPLTTEHDGGPHGWW